MTTIGLDISYNSTGMCILKENAAPIMYQICPSKSKHSASVHFDTYHREYSDTDDYSRNELNRIIDAESLAIKIRTILRNYVSKSEPCQIRIEGPMNMAFVRSSMKYHNGNDMVVINKIVCLYLMKLENVELLILPITKIKKAFCGKGNGKKEFMIEKFKELFPDFDYTGKYDDVVDAYALASSKF